MLTGGNLGKPMNYLAAIDLGGGDGFIHQLEMFLLVGLALLVLYFIGWWFATRPKIVQMAPIALTVWQGLFVLVGGLVLINFLLGLAGHGFVKW